MGLGDGIQYKGQMKEWFDLSKGSHFKLREPISLDELYDLMTERWDTRAFGNFYLEKGLISDCILLENYYVMGLSLCLTIYVTSYLEMGGKSWYNRNKMVIIAAKSNKPPAHTKAEKEEIEEVYNEAFPLALERFRAVRDAMRDVLSDRVL
ncbi:MAG: hypothetical protein FWF87_00940 [Synergistaceae bacterium]|nr:hypothetical protein [Synergistaceae bacterium]